MTQIAETLPARPFARPGTDEIDIELLLIVLAPDVDVRFERLTGETATGTILASILVEAILSALSGIVVFVISSSIAGRQSASSRTRSASSFTPKAMWRCSSRETLPMPSRNPGSRSRRLSDSSIRCWPGWASEASTIRW